MSPIHFNHNHDEHSTPFLHLRPHEVVDEDVAMGRKKEIHDLKFTILKSYNHHQHGNDPYHNGTSSSSSSAKYESPKMRLYQKFIKASDDDQIIEDQNLTQDGSPWESSGENSTNNIIRICADCGTTKTPLWRSGPHGPKSLCNACGIRQRKARRAAMAASDGACATNSNATTKFNLLHKDMGMGASPKTKKRSKNYSTKKPLMPNDQTKKICFQEFALNLSNKLSLHQLFPQDEKEAAILLMALSSGFVEG